MQPTQPEESYKLYQGRLQPVSFKCPQDWTPNTLIETFSIGQSESGYIEIPGHSPSMVYFSVGQPTFVSASVGQEHELTVVTSTPVSLRNWPEPVCYVEAVAAVDDGAGYSVSFGISSPNQLCDTPKTVRTNKEVLPLIVKDASTPEGQGVLVFSGSVYGFATKELAQNYFQDPLYQRVKGMILTVGFDAPPRAPNPIPQELLEPTQSTATVIPANNVAPPDVTPMPTPGTVTAPDPAPQATPEDPTTLRIPR